MSIPGRFAGSGFASPCDLKTNVGAVRYSRRDEASLNAPDAVFSVKAYGAIGDGAAIDSPSINRAIDAAAAAGGGTIYFPAGTYASYSIRLKSHVSLHLDRGATILAASTPLDGTASGGYDAAEPQGAWEPYQDYGHNHWHNSLIWGDGIHDISILGRGLDLGQGLKPRPSHWTKISPTPRSLAWATKPSR